MAEAKSNNEQRGSGRRRYFRRSSDGRKGNNPSTKENPNAKKEKSPERASGGRDGRLGRRRRRTRSRNSPAVTAQETTTRESIVNLEDYVPPQGLFIYTHVARPASRDSYEFRAEHFSSVGRRLEDYEVDLSKLFAEGGVLASADEAAIEE